MIIRDETLGRYEIHCDRDNYTVIEPKGRKDKKGNELRKTHAYCSSMANAVKKICELQTLEAHDVCDLKTYVNEIHNASGRIETALS